MIEIYIQPPCRRTIIIRNIRHFLPFPYLIFKTVINESCKLFLAATIELPKPNSVIYYAPFGNFNTAFEMCLGAYYANSHKDLINRFWQSQFTGVSGARTPEEFKYCFDVDLDKWDLDKWENYPLEKILEVSWIPSGLTYQTFKDQDDI